MNRNYQKALLLLGAMGCLAIPALGQKNPLPFPPIVAGTDSFITQDWVTLCLDPKSTTSPYSTDWGIEYEYDALFGAVMGVSGTVNYSKFCFGPSGITIPMAGRLGFYIGTDPTTGLGGSTQDNLAGTVVDDGMGLTFGTYTGVAGNFSIAKIFAGTPGSTTTTGQYFGQNKIDTAYWGASDRYFVGETTNGNFRIILRVDVLGDAARCDWKMTNTATTAATVGLWFGQWVTFLGPQGSHTADYVSVPGLKPLSIDTRFRLNANPAANNPPELELPPYINYGLYQSWAYGLQVVLQPSAQIPDQTPANGLDVGKNGFLLGSMYASDGAMPDVILQDTPFLNGTDAYIEKFDNTPVGAAGSGTEMREVVAYYRSTWSTSDYAKPYSVVLDAPPVIATTPGQPQTFQNAPFFITVDIDDTRGFSTTDQSVPLEGVEIALDLPTGMADANNPGSNHMVKFLSSVQPQTIQHVTFQVAVDPTLFGNQQYTVTVTPTPGPVKVLKGTVVVASQPYLQLTGTANLVTAPWQFSSSDWPTILGSSGLVLDQDYQVFGWDAVAQDYILQTDPQRGFGSFIVSNQNVGYVPLGGNPQQVSDLQTGAPQIILQPGWNMIANPYNYAIPLGQLVGVPEADNTNAYTFTQLANLGYVSGSLAYWNTLIQGYSETTSFADLIQPNTGYWLYVESNLPVTLQYPPVFQAFLPGLVDGLGNLNPKKVKTGGLGNVAPLWTLQLAARSNGMVDGTASIGQANTAQNAKYLTRFKAPVAPVKNAISSSIQVQNGSKTVQYSEALVAKTVTNQTWNWRVYSQSTGEVTVTWPNMSKLPANIHVKMVDTASGATVDLRSTSNYSYSAKAQTAHNFKLEVQVGPALPVINSVVAKASSSTSVILYNLSVNASTTVTVKQNGTMVTTLVNNRADATGTSRANWNYMDSANRRVRPGIYEVEVDSTPNGGTTETKSISVTVSR